MPALQVRDFPDELYEELRLCAQQEYRSITQQTVVAVKDYLRRKEEQVAQKSEHTPTIDYIERRRQLFERIDALPTVVDPEGFPTPQEIIRELRDSR